MNIACDAAVSPPSDLPESSAETLSFSVHYELADRLQARVLYFPKNMLSWRSRI